MNLLASVCLIVSVQSGTCLFTLDYQVETAIPLDMPCETFLPAALRASVLTCEIWIDGSKAGGRKGAGH